MVPHIAILKMTIEEQENLLAAREPGFNADDYGVMVDRRLRMNLQDSSLFPQHRHSKKSLSRNVNLFLCPLIDRAGLEAVVRIFDLCTQFQ